MMHHNSQVWQLRGSSVPPAHSAILSHFFAQINSEAGFRQSVSPSVQGALVVGAVVPVVPLVVGFSVDGATKNMIMN